MDLPFGPLYLVPWINNHVLALMLYGIVWLTHHDPIAISATSLFVNAAANLQFLNSVDNDAMAYSKLPKNLSAPKRTTRVSLRLTVHAQRGPSYPEHCWYGRLVVHTVFSGAVSDTANSLVLQTSPNTTGKKDDLRHGFLCQRQGRTYYVFSRVGHLQSLQLTIN